MGYSVPPPLLATPLPVKSRTFLAPTVTLMPFPSTNSLRFVKDNIYMNQTNLLNFIAQCDHDCDFDQLDLTTQASVRLIAEGIDDELHDRREGRFGESLVQYYSHW